MIPPRISKEPWAAMKMSVHRTRSVLHDTNGDLPSAKRENNPPSVSIDKNTQSLTMSDPNQDIQRVQTY